jgi:TolA-binding protein
LLGELFFATKDYKQCYETLVSLNKDFADYPQWVGKSFLVLADNFQATGEVFQARGTLQSLIDNFPLPEIKEAARKKLDALQKAEAQKQVTPADSVDNQNRR